MSAASGSVALITGITGQDGSYLAESLLADGVEVHGTTRGGESVDRFRGWLDDRADSVVLHPVGEPIDYAALLARIAPTAIYHLAGQTHVGRSFEAPLETLDANARGTLALLEAVRRSPRRDAIRLVNASSAAVFGSAPHPQTEATPLAPASPYACSKAYAQLQTAMHRGTYGLHASSVILYNHESPRRGPAFVTRKIARAAAAISLGCEDGLTLGSLDVGRDWGHARDFVHAMRLVAAADTPDDYIIATGTYHTLADLLDLAFGHVGLDWAGLVRQDPALIRPDDDSRLQGDASKIRERLGWVPRTTLAGLVAEMVDAELAALR